MCLARGYAWLRPLASVTRIIRLTAVVPAKACPERVKVRLRYALFSECERWSSGLLPEHMRNADMGTLDRGDVGRFLTDISAHGRLRYRRLHSPVLAL